MILYSFLEKIKTLINVDDIEIGYFLKIWLLESHGYKGLQGIKKMKIFQSKWHFYNPL